MGDPGVQKREGRGRGNGEVGFSQVLVYSEVHAGN